MWTRSVRLLIDGGIKMLPATADDQIIRLMSNKKLSLLHHTVSKPSLSMDGSFLNGDGGE
jgi:hypothetical protein